MKATTVERLEIVLGADSSPYMQEVRKVIRQTGEVAKAVGQKVAGIGKQLREITQPMREAMEPTRQLNEELREMMSINPSGKGFKDIQKEIERTEKKLRNLLMAQGDLELDGKHTKQTDAFKQLQREIAAAEQSLGKLRSKIDELEDAGGDTEYTEDYKAALQLLDQEEKKLDRLLERRAKAQALGGNAMRGSSWKALNYDIEEKQNSIAEQRNNISNMKPWEKYQNTQQWTVLQVEIEKTELKLASLKAQMESMPDTEKYQNTDQWVKNQREIERTRQELAQLNAAQYEFNRTAKVRRIPKVFTGLLTTLKSFTSGIKKAGGAFASLIHKMKNGIPILNRTRNSMHGMGQTGKGLKGIFSTLGMTARFMAASFLITGTLNGAKEGMKNLAQYSDRTNESISVLYGGVTSLKNAFATAFAPILEVVTPYLDILITHLIEGANAIGHFFAALTGSATWTKAVKVQQDYAGSLNNTAAAAAEAKRELYGFDEITKQSDNSSGAAAGAGGVAVGDMFATEEVTNQFSDFAEKVKEAWRNADFTEIGNIVGEQLKRGLDNIDWNGIQSKCNRIARSIGTFINGFIQTDGLADQIGSTIGNAVNTGVGFAHTFFTTTSFEALGSFIAETANGFIDTADFSLLGQTVGECIRSGVESWHGFVESFDFSSLKDKLSDAINSWAHFMNATGKNGRTGWQLLGEDISDSLRGITQTLTGVLKTVDWDEIGQDIVDCLCTIDWENLAWDLWGLVKAFFGAVGDTLWGAATGIVQRKIGPEDEETQEYIQDISKSVRDGDYESAKAAAEKYNDTASKDAKKNYLDDTLKYLGLSGYANSLEKKGAQLYGIADDKLTGVKDLLKEKSTQLYDIVNGGDVGKSSDAELDVPVATSTTAKDLLNPLQKVASRNPLKTGIVTTKSGEDVQSDLQEGVTGAGPLITAAKTSNNGYLLFDFLQKDFVKDELHTGAKSDTSGFSIFEGIQGVFGRNAYHAGAKSDTGGGTIFTGIQSVFGRSIFHTGAKSDTGGDSIRQGLQRSFGSSALSTWSTVTNSGTELRSGLQRTFGSSPLQIGVSLIRDGWNTVTEWVNSFFGSGSGARGAAIKKKAEGGVFAGGTWRPVTAYATGGMPASGQFFMAREAGPELVGTIGNHTAVMNNNQIVSSVSSGVYSAVLSAMSQTMSGQRSGTPIQVLVQIGDKEVTDYVVKDINGRTLATGKCPIVT